MKLDYKEFDEDDELPKSAPAAVVEAEWNVPDLSPAIRPVEAEIVKPPVR